MKLIENCDYFIYYKELPPKIYAFSFPNADGTFTVVLDPRRPMSVRLGDLEHELNHIRRGDFWSDLPVSIIERL